MAIRIHGKLFRPRFQLLHRTEQGARIDRSVLSEPEPPPITATLSVSDRTRRMAAFERRRRVELDVAEVLRLIRENPQQALECACAGVQSRQVRSLLESVP
ncbi:MAG: hypothetical protein KatS3mg115_1035 [Candidatus Poribacteria bacterium]|nr:MAG: hypothetical protein KatS3mg115_1035 [Candidatus Poribacteria bacterium]